MCTEKLAKVYFWRHGHFPGLGHHKFGPFLRDLDATRPTDFRAMFGYKAPSRFLIQRLAIIDLAEGIQNLLLASGNTGPIPDYPCPPILPCGRRFSHSFPEWHDWCDVVAVTRFRRFRE